MPINPPPRYKLEKGQQDLFEKSLAHGLDDRTALLRAGIPLTALNDVLSEVGPERCAELRAMSVLPLAEVRVRVNEIMLQARNPDAPMGLEDALDILGRKDSTWSQNQKVDHSSLGKALPTPILMGVVGGIPPTSEPKEIEGNKQLSTSSVDGAAA